MCVCVCVCAWFRESRNPAFGLKYPTHARSQSRSSPVTPGKSYRKANSQRASREIEKRGIGRAHRRTGQDRIPTGRANGIFIKKKGAPELHRLHLVGNISGKPSLSVLCCLLGILSRAHFLTTPRTINPVTRETRRHPHTLTHAAFPWVSLVLGKFRRGSAHSAALTRELWKLPELIAIL